MFDGCSKLTTISSIFKEKTTLPDMDYMFYKCSSLTQLDLSNWDTTNVTTMYAMFNGCDLLTSLDVSNFDTSKVANMGYMFSGCDSLTSLDLDNFDTSKVTTMFSMFRDCSSLTSLDLSNFDTSNVTYITDMFTNCSSLRKIKLINAIIPQLIEILPTRSSSSVGYLFSPTPISNEKNWNTIITYTGYNITIKTSQPLGKNDKLYWSSSNNRFEIDRNGVIEVPIVEGDIVDLPRLYQKEDATINISTDNIKPSKIAIEYKDINNN